jgi:hypothetical protein
MLLAYFEWALECPIRRPWRFLICFARKLLNSGALGMQRPPASDSRDHGIFSTLDVAAADRVVLPIEQRITGLAIQRGAQLIEGNGR